MMAKLSHEAVSTREKIQSQDDIVEAFARRNEMTMQQARVLLGIFEENKMHRNEEMQGGPMDAAMRGEADQRAEFLKDWLRTNLPPFYKPSNVVELAAKLKKDAAAAGVSVTPDGNALAAELIVQD